MSKTEASPSRPGEEASEVRRTDIEVLLANASRSDSKALATLLTIVERGGAPARALAGTAAKSSGAAKTVGITGAPGAGKSTLTDAYIAELRRRTSDGVSVLAVDPSSPYSGGAILGDRVRMARHVLDSGVFVRSMATRGHLGGLASAVPGAIRVLDAVGWPTVIVETVGVGQVEIEVAGTCDTTVVVVTPGWGDAVQASKAGLLEIADVFVINKSDWPGVEGTRRDLLDMLGRAGHGSWVPPVLTTVAADGTGVEALVEAVDEHAAHLESTGELQQRRRQRIVSEIRRMVSDRVLSVVDEVAASPTWLAEVGSGHRAIDPLNSFAALTEGVVESLRGQPNF